MDTMFISKMQKLNLTGPDLIRQQYGHAGQKWQFMIEKGLIKKDGWWPET